MSAGGGGMKASRQVRNQGLAALIAGSGFRSWERFAQAVNERGWQMHGIKTNYDHVSVKRWLAGGTCQNPDVVAEVLGTAWGVPVPIEVIWPQHREGGAPIPAHLQPWSAERTLEQLGYFLRSDMLTRRETLTKAVEVATGPAILAPIARWLSVPAVAALAAKTEGGQRIGAGEVTAIEAATRYFARTDAVTGGALSREAAVGQLKYAVDLAQHASYSSLVGNRLLAAIAELAGLVGWMCHDSNMPGPAQRYLTYGLQAARESTDPRAALLMVSILSDMAQHMRWLGRPNTALRLHDLAAAQLPHDRNRFNVMRAILATKRANDALCYLGLSCLPEIRNALSMSRDLHAHASEEDRAAAPRQWHRAIDTSVGELSAMAAATHLVLARSNRSLAAEAEGHTVAHLAEVGTGQGRNKVFSHIRLASIRFISGEPEQACLDADQALTAPEGQASAMVKIRLRELVDDSQPYSHLPQVAELQDRIRRAHHDL
jgi:hypothetical protein